MRRSQTSQAPTPSPTARPTGRQHSNIATVTITVNAVNDAPSGASATVTLSEDGTYTFSGADFGFADTSDSPAHALLTVTIDSLPAAGSLTLTGAPKPRPTLYPRPTLRRTGSSSRPMRMLPARRTLRSISGFRTTAASRTAVSTATRRRARSRLPCSPRTTPRCFATRGAIDAARHGCRLLHRKRERAVGGRHRCRQQCREPCIVR